MSFLVKPSPETTNTISKLGKKKLPLGYWVLHTHNKGLFQLANTIFHGGVGDQAEDVISHNNLSQYTDEQWRRQSRSTKTAVFVLGWITNANRAAMILAWIDKKEWGGGRRVIRRMVLQLMKSMSKPMQFVKKKTTEPC